VTAMNNVLRRLWAVVVLLIFLTHTQLRSIKPSAGLLMGDALIAVGLICFVASAFASDPTRTRIGKWAYGIGLLLCLAGLGVQVLIAVI